MFLIDPFHCRCNLLSFLKQCVILPECYSNALFDTKFKILFYFKPHESETEKFDEGREHKKCTGKCARMHNFLCML